MPVLSSAVLSMQHFFVGMTVEAYTTFDIHGTLTVNGVEYNGAMPEFGSQLNDAEIVSVLIKFAVSGA